MFFLLDKAMEQRECGHYEVARALHMTVFEFEKKLRTNGFGSLDIEKMVEFLEIKNPQNIFFTK